MSEDVTPTAGDFTRPDLMSVTNVRFNPPPGWPDPPAEWVPPANWAPDARWPPAPPGWQFWVPVEFEPPDPNRDDRGVSRITNGTYGQVGAGRHAAPTAGSPGASPAPVATGRHAAPAATDPAIAGPGPRAFEAAVPQHEARDVESSTQQVADAERRIRALEDEEAQLRDRIIELRGAVALRDAGFYDYQHPLENAEQYKPLLADLQARTTELIRLGRAVLASTTFSYDNSVARGRKIASDLSRLMLRAYNAEAESNLRSLRADGVAAAVRRLEDAASTIARLGAVMDLRIAPEYHELRVQEVRLTADYLMKTQEQQDSAREDRARMRREHSAQQQFAQERERLDRERNRVLDALPVAERQGKERESAELRERLAQIDAAIEQNERQAAELRAGYVYVASNIGAFGAEIVKIGVTRMPDPLEMVRQLGDESVPFPFDMHFFAYSDDAPALASHLHALFASRRVNHADPRREFFFATPQEVLDTLSANLENEVYHVEGPEASQYHHSRGRWPEELRE